MVAALADDTRAQQNRRGLFDAVAACECLSKIPLVARRSTLSVVLVLLTACGLDQDQIESTISA